MSLPPVPTLHPGHAHYGWDRTIAPALTVAPGERVTVARLDPARANPLTGPIRVDDALPGDALAIESAMEVSLCIEVIRDAAPTFPRYETRGPRPGDADRTGDVATTGTGPDLMMTSRDAVAGMIDHLSRSRSLSPEDAYMLCSIAADLRISEPVDAPNSVVSCVISRSLFSDRASV